MHNHLMMTHTAAARRVPSYFISEKWVFDRKALVTSRKAHAKLDGAIEHIYATGFENQEFDMDMDSLEAWRILYAANKRVAETLDEAQRVAKAAYDR